MQALWLNEESAINETRVKEKTGSMSADELRAVVKEFAANIGTWPATKCRYGRYRYSSSYLFCYSCNMGHNCKERIFFQPDTLTPKNLNVNRRLIWIRFAKSNKLQQR